MFLTPQLLLEAYAQGFFPMAESRRGKDLRWFCPEWRGVIPLQSFHIPRSLAKFLKKNPFEFRLDSAFEEVIAACAARGPGRKDTWISAEIEAAYTALWRQGHAHSVECWKDGALAGGLYGVRIGGAFFGESMFSRASGASKAALAHLAGILKENGFTLLDAQFWTEHLAQFGAVEMPRGEYLELLRNAIAIPASWPGGCSPKP